MLNSYRLLWKKEEYKLSLDHNFAGWTLMGYSLEKLEGGLEAAVGETVSEQQILII
jgi:hypothetical protein